MEEGAELELELDFSGSSTTTMDDDMATWNEWSPVVDWEVFSGHDDFRGLIESMMDENENEDDYDSPIHRCNSLSMNGAIAMEEDKVVVHEMDGEDSKGLRLVHLLMAAAEALTGVNKSRELARVILVRLRELVSPTGGTNMERLAVYFSDALQELLEGVGGAHGKQSGSHHGDDLHHQTDVLAAFQLLQDMSPYIKFGHFTANQAILEAVAQDRRVHIVDYDIMEGIQWASLMQALVSRKDGPTAPHLKITAVARGAGGNGRKSIGTVQETGRRLVAFAASIGQPFSFHQCRLDSDENFRPSGLKLVKGEALVVNCMLHLPHSSHRSPESVASFLSGARALNPRLVTLVEEEVGPTMVDGGFVGRFMDSLHHYSAVYDSLEAGFPIQGRARALVERVFLGPRIAGTVARSYRARWEEGDGWGQWITGAGFSPVEISCFNHCQAKLLLGLFNDGYRVEEMGKNKLVLAWKSRRLLSASAWTSSSHNGPPVDSGVLNP